MTTKPLMLMSFLTLSALPTPGAATTVSFTGKVENLCILTLTTSGTLRVSNDGTRLSSTETGGLKAIMAVVSTGTNPTLSFTAPSLTGPTVSTSGATTMLGYTSLAGANRVLQTGSSSYVANRLLDTLTIDGAAINGAGFANGDYTLSSTVTCQQSL